MMEIDIRQFFSLWKDKEKRLGRKLSMAEAVSLTGLSHEAIRKIRDNETTRFDAIVIGKLCWLLDVPPGQIPFLVYSPSETTAGYAGSNACGVGKFIPVSEGGRR